MDPGPHPGASTPIYTAETHALDIEAIFEAGAGLFIPLTGAISVAIRSVLADDAGPDDVPRVQELTTLYSVLFAIWLLNGAQVRVCSAVSV